MAGRIRTDLEMPNGYNFTERSLETGGVSIRYGAGSVDPTLGETDFVAPRG
jgi:hypothetical protein